MIEWHRKVSDSKSMQELVETTADFLRTLGPSEWASVPDNCRPLGIQGAHGIRFWHDRLVDEFCVAAAEMRHSRTHQDLVAFFIAALERAEELDPAWAANDARACQRRPTES